MSYPFSLLLEGVELAKQAVGTNLAVKGPRYKRDGNVVHVLEFQGSYKTGDMVDTWSEWTTHPDGFVVFDSYIVAVRPETGDEIKCTSVDDEA